MQEEPARLRLQVGQGQGGQLAGAQRRGVAEQDEGTVAGAGDGGGVDRRDDRLDLGQVEGVGRAAGGGAQGSAQAAANLAHGLVLDRVGQVPVAVLGADGGAGQFQGGDADALLGAFGQVGAEGMRCGWQRRDAAGGAPAGPGAPGARVDRVGSRGAAGGDGGGDPGGAGDGQPSGSGSRAQAARRVMPG